MQVLEAHHFRLPACRFVLDLFDKRVLQQIVLEEEEDEEDEDADTDSESDSHSDGEQPAGVNGATKIF